MQESAEPFPQGSYENQFGICGIGETESRFDRVHIGYHFGDFVSSYLVSSTLERGNGLYIQNIARSYQILEVFFRNTFLTESRYPSKCIADEG
jgi:hypothetical protein